MRLHRIFGSASVLLLALLTTSYAQNGSPKRTMIDPFQISLETVDHELSNQERLFVRSEVERVLSNYMMNVYQWPSTLVVAFVAVARVLSYVPIEGNEGAVIGARLTFDGLVYFSDASVNIPTASELHSIVADALDPETLVPALQQQFPSVTSVELDQSLTAWPTASPTASPILSPTAAPTVVATKRPTSPPTAASTDYPTLSPTPMPTTRQPTPWSLTAAPTVAPSVLPTTIEPTTRPTPSPTETAMTQSPTSLVSSVSPTVSPTLLPPVSPTVSPTLLPPVSPVNSPTVSPTVATSPPQDDTESNGDELVANKDSNPAIVAGAVTASLLLVLIIGILAIRRRKARDEENPETTVDILNDLKAYEANGRNEPATTQTFSHSSAGGNAEQEYDEERSPKGAGFLKCLGVKQQGRDDDDPPHLAMTDGSDAGESDGSELRSDGERTSLAELYRGWWSRPSTVASGASVSSSGASAMVQSVESFERRKVDNHMVRKDILESPDLSAATLSQYKTSHALRASLVNEEEYDCALAPTDISAASLALKRRAEDSGGEDVEQVLTGGQSPNFSEDSSTDSRNNTARDRDGEGDMISSGFAALFNSWWGTSKTNRHASLLGGSTDDDTFGERGDWDPDDETRTSDDHSLPFKADAEDQSSLLDSTKNVTYQMQRLRTPPEGPETRPKPITAPAGPRDMKSPPRTPMKSRSPGSPHPILHHEAGDTSEDVYDL